MLDDQASQILGTVDEITERARGWEALLCALSRIRTLRCRHALISALHDEARATLYFGLCSLLHVRWKLNDRSTAPLEDAG